MRERDTKGKMSRKEFGLIPGRLRISGRSGLKDKMAQDPKKP